MSFIVLVVVGVVAAGADACDAAGETSRQYGLPQEVAARHTADLVELLKRLSEAPCGPGGANMQKKEKKRKAPKTLGWCREFTAPSTVSPAGLDSLCGAVGVLHVLCGLLETMAAVQRQWC